MELHKALQELADAIKKIVRQRIIDKGYNVRARRNTLADSRLLDSVDTKVKGDDTVVFVIADYFGYIITGQKAGKRREDGHTFRRAIEQWVIEKGIEAEFNKDRDEKHKLTQDDVIYLVMKRIIESGVPERPFLDNPFKNDTSNELVDDPSLFMPFLDNLLDEWRDKLFDEIIKDLDKHFK